MRKFVLLIAAIAAALSSVSCSSCNKDDESFGIEYSLESTGKTNGFVELAFVGGGGFKISGDAGYEFHWSNVSDAKEPEGDEANKLRAAEYVNGWIDENIKVVDYAGDYDVYVKGYVLETLTQIKVEIDRHFTNISE